MVRSIYWNPEKGVEILIVAASFLARFNSLNPEKGVEI